MYDRNGRPLPAPSPTPRLAPRQTMNRDLRAVITLLALIGTFAIIFTILSLWFSFGWKAGLAGAGLCCMTFGVLFCWAAACEIQTP